MHLNELVNEILTKYDTRRAEAPYLVGVDGLGGAGKTTLVQQLKAELESTAKVVVLHMDNHIVERNKRYDTGYEEWYEYYFLQWDIEMLEEELFKKVYNNESKLTLPFYDISVDQHKRNTISISEDSIILIEGIFLQRKEWKPYFDFIVFVNCSKEKRFARIVKRDTYLGDNQIILEKYKKRYWLAEDYYLETENPVKSADIVYNCL
ncbi:kinase [Oceanobacillus indicireducens]|uniref:kinase n=1 Tax=Oceanobacillus indicireducens TaxID=1004261 RepID=UPI00166A3FA9|nr:kinase [Oceanobacillus indicireducens]